jgi:hypothetical protein
MWGRPGQRKRGAKALALGVAACALLTAPGASAQAPGEPEAPAGPVVDVLQVLVPATQNKLLERGVKVQASCTPDCLLVVKLSVSDKAAASVGLSNPVVGTGVAAGPDGVPVWIRTRITKKAREAFSALPADTNLRVRVTAQP